MGKLDGKVAIITGASMGMGKAEALTFAREGARLAICASSSLVELEKTAAEIREHGGEVSTIKTDVSNKLDVEHLFALTIEKYQRIDILVNNAGIVRRAPLVDLTEEDWDRVLAVDLKGAFLCAQAAAREMVKLKYGKIINVSSLAGLGHLLLGQAAYGPAKAGVIALTKVAARELGPYGICVNCIAPGRIDTRMAYRNGTPEEIERVKQQIKQTSSLGRMGTVEEVAKVALFLASDDSSYVTGQTIKVDGGRFDAM